MRPSTIFFLIVAGIAMVVSSATTAADSDDGTAPEMPGFDEGGTTGPVTLREAAYVNSDVVLLGDIFLNTGSLAGKSIAYAPTPGEMITFGNRWLHRVSRYYGLGWTPTRANQDIRVVRESVMIGHAEIMDAIRLALSDQGYSQDWNAELVSRNIQIHLPTTAKPDVAIESLRVNERTNRFAVVVAAPANDLSAKRLQLTGRIYQTMEIPVTTRPIPAGELIRQEDLEWRRLPVSRVSGDTLVSEPEIVGMMPRRSLRSGDVFRSSHIKAPVLVPNKSLVTVTLEHPFMTLTVQGRAMEAGARGDVIRIRNIASKIILDAEVVGSGRAVVHTPAQLAAN